MFDDDIKMYCFLGVVRTWWLCVYVLIVSLRMKSDDVRDLLKVAQGWKSGWGSS